MADVNANIGVNIDTSAALAQLKALQRQISQFHTSIAKSSESAAIAQRSLQKNLIGSINSIGAFSAELRTVKTSAESFTNSLEKNKFSMREYFRYAGASTKTFGRLFKSEFDTIGKVSEERVKTLQTQYIKMGRNASGAMEAIAIRPTALNMQDLGTKTAIAAQKQALFNQLMKQGTTNLLNFGKNTQWAGRQLMVGFTIPLSIVGSAATKTFMDMEVQAIKFKKVYGDLFTPKAETQQALDDITELGRQFTKYGVAVSTTVGLAAEAAAAGFQGLDLQRQTTEATRLSILGQIDTQKALETTISLQNAFGMSSDKLADSINFLNAVENQTVVSLDDITTAIPKVAPVIEQLGGNVKDLTFFLAAMKEGGINASEGANALKSGLAALINPTGRASEMLAQFGINAKEIVVKNKGDLKATVIEFAEALNQLDPLNRAQAIEQMFGKFQFARLSALFANVTKEGNQASRVLTLANSSVEELSALSEQELGMTADSAMNKFKKSVEDLKLALVPVGKAFLEAATPIVEFVGGVLEKFGNLSAGTKRLITVLTVAVGAIGPIFLMTFGLLANALANTMKGAMILRQGYLRLTGQSQILGEQTQYLNTEQLEAAAAAHSLDQSHAKLTQQFTAETAALQKLIAAYQGGTRAGNAFMLNNPGMMMPPRGAVRKLASGIVSVPGPKGAGDIVPAMLSPGEAVIPAKFVEKYGPLIEGMVSGNIPGYQLGRSPSSASGMVFAHGAPGGNLSSETIQQ
jgi:TP901 family phage tail tape measure protein